MAVRKDTKSGKWLAEAYVKGKRIRKLFDSKVEANRFYNALKNQNSPFYQLIQVKTPIRLSEMVIVVGVSRAIFRRACLASQRKVRTDCSRFK